MFSVVVPVFNKHKTLRRAVSSVLAQRLEDFELIVVDDGSTDESLSALDGLEDSRLRIVRQANQGPGPARNAGAAHGSASWIAFLDADDFWYEDHLSELDALRRTAPHAGLIGTGYVHARLGEDPVQPSVRGQARVIDYLAAIGRGEEVLHTSSAAVRRDVWDKLGGFAALPSGQDSEFWARIALAYPVATTTRKTSVYVHGTGGISDSQTTRWLGRPLRTAADLSPAVATLLARRADLPLWRHPQVDAYVRRYLIWCIRGSAWAGDLATLRAARALGSRSLGYADRCRLAAARLPDRLARLALRLIDLPSLR